MLSPSLPDSHSTLKEDEPTTHKRMLEQMARWATPGAATWLLGSNEAQPWKWKSQCIEDAFPEVRGTRTKIAHT